MSGESIANLVIYVALFVLAMGLGVPLAKVLFRFAVWYWGKIPI